jgi:hypothetical protein
MAGPHARLLGTLWLMSNKPRIRKSGWSAIGRRDGGVLRHCTSGGTVAIEWHVMVTSVGTWCVCVEVSHQWDGGVVGVVIRA